MIQSKLPVVGYVLIGVVFVGACVAVAAILIDSKNDRKLYVKIFRLIGGVVAIPVGLYLLSLIPKVSGVYVGRALAVLLVLALCAGAIWGIIYGVRRLAALYTAMRRPFRRREFTPSKWKDLIVQTEKDAYDQENLLARTQYDSVGLDAAGFLLLLTEIEIHIAGEPATSTYWSRRNELEEVLRQERRG